MPGAGDTALAFWIAVVEVPVLLGFAGWLYALGRRIERVKDEYVRRDDWHREVDALRGDVRLIGEKIDALKDWIRPATVPVVSLGKD